MPFMDEPPGANVSASMIGVYGRAIRALRSIHQQHVEQRTEVAASRRLN
jgi:hypothetical protein